jgi:molybdenum cofactor biosynthesis protein B
MGHKEHREKAPRSVAVAIVSISSTRTLETDESGLWIAKQAGREGHRVVAHQMAPDDSDAIRRTVLHILADHAPAALIATGGTGITPKDVTIEALQPLFVKELTGFSPLFTQLSFEQVDAAAMISRATAGVIGRTLVFCLPGSLKACQLACKELIFPELSHLCGHLVES